MSVSQAIFHEALLSPQAEVPDGLTDGLGRPAGRRFAVYRNNVAASLTSALELSFPAVAKLIGTQNFRTLAGVFLRQHPPSVPMLSQYGSEMPDFLQDFAPLAQLGYLPDVARLEQAIRLSYHAADAAPADPAQLQMLPAEALAEIRFALAPAVRLLRSRWPIHAIWAFNLKDGPKPMAGAQNVLILRPDFDPELHVIPDGAACFIENLSSGSPLSAAQEAALEADPAFDLSSTLGLLLTGRAISAIISEPS